MSSQDISTERVTLLLNSTTEGDWVLGSYYRIETFASFSVEDSADYWLPIAYAETEEDAYFIANSKQLVKDLLADRDRLEAELAEERQHHVHTNNLWAHDRALLSALNTDAKDLSQLPYPYKTK